jgi:hypothetical protein
MYCTYIHSLALSVETEQVCTHPINGVPSQDVRMDPASKPINPLVLFA